MATPTRAAPFLTPGSGGEVIDLTDSPPHKPTQAPPLPTLAHVFVTRCALESLQSCLRTLEPGTIFNSSQLNRGQAIQGLVRLCEGRGEGATTFAVVKLLQILYQPPPFPEKDKRCAIEELGRLGVFVPSIQRNVVNLLGTILNKHEAPAYAREAALCGLSRVCRRTPSLFHDVESYFMSVITECSASSSSSVEKNWDVAKAALIGVGRICQSDTAQRERWVPILIKLCTHDSLKVRCGALRGLSFAVCPLHIASSCFELQEECFKIAAGVWNRELNTSKQGKMDSLLPAAARALCLIATAQPSLHERILGMFVVVISNQASNKMIYSNKVLRVSLVCLGRLLRDLDHTLPAFRSSIAMLKSLGTSAVFGEAVAEALCLIALAKPSQFADIKLFFLANGWDWGNLKWWCKLVSCSNNPMQKQFKGFSPAPPLASPKFAQRFDTHQEFAKVTAAIRTGHPSLLRSEEQQNVKQSQFPPAPLQEHPPAPAPQPTTQTNEKLKPAEPRPERPRSQNSSEHSARFRETHGIVLKALFLQITRPDEAHANEMRSKIIKQLIFDANARKEFNHPAPARAQCSTEEWAQKVEQLPPHQQAAVRLILEDPSMMAVALAQAANESTGGRAPTPNTTLAPPQNLNEPRGSQKRRAEAPREESQPKRQRQFTDQS